MKTTSLVLAFAFTATTLLAEPPQLQDDLRKTLSAASKENKMAFILLGRPTCGNCNQTKKSISEGRINVTSAEFVMADLNTDDARTNADFMRKYGREKWGDMLPFVVVTDSKGKVLANSSGYRKAEDWNTLLAEAKAKAGAKPGAIGAGSNWPFNKSAPATPKP